MLKLAEAGGVIDEPAYAAADVGVDAEVEADALLLFVDGLVDLDLDNVVEKP